MALVAAIPTGSPIGPACSLPPGSRLCQQVADESTGGQLVELVRWELKQALGSSIQIGFGELKFLGEVVQQLPLLV